MENGKHLDELSALVESNELHPVLEKSFSIDEAEEAVRYVLERDSHLVGKIALDLRS